MKHIVLLFLTLAAGPAAACQDDAWRHPAPLDTHWKLVANPIDRSAHAEVLEARREAAVARLQGRVARPLTRRQAAEFVGTQAAARLKGPVYLLRALRVPTHNGAFHVYEAGAEVMVGYGYLGAQGGAALRTAVVAALRAHPRTLYVGCSGAS